MADERTERVARNEAVFREVNERIRESADRLTSPDEADFLCECGNRGCVQMINMSLEEYESVRSSGKRFAVVPGHEILDLERVVEQNARFTVVEKIGPGADIAEESDPRGRR